MDMNNSQTVNADPRLDRLDVIDKELHLIHWDSPQKATKAHHALSVIREGLNDLASIGHNFHLAHGLETNTTIQEYPKMLTRGGQEFPFELTVENELEEDDARKRGFGFVHDGKEGPLAPDRDSDEMAHAKSATIGSGTQPDPGALTAVDPQVITQGTPAADSLPSSTHLDKSIDGALGDPNNVNFQAPKPEITDKDAVESLKKGPQGSTPTMSDQAAKEKTVGGKPE